MPAFNNQKYLELQAQKISERISKFNNKLYLEFGGKYLMIIMHQEFCQVLLAILKLKCY